MTDLPKSCSDVRAHVHLFVGGDLEAPVARAVGDHISACAPCREGLLAAREARRALVSLREDQAGDTPDLWPGVRAKLVSGGHLNRSGRLRPASAGRRPAGRLLSGPWVGAISGLAAACLVAYGLWTTGVLSPAPEAGPDPSGPAAPSLSEALVQGGGSTGSGSVPLEVTTVASPATPHPSGGLRSVPIESALSNVAEDFPIKGERERPMMWSLPNQGGNRAASQQSTHR